MPKQPIVINLFDNNFRGHACSVAGKMPRLMRYQRENLTWDGITIFTDGWMFDPVVDQVQSTYKIGWLHEGRALRPANYVRSASVLHKFDAIFTYDEQLLDSDPRYKLCIRGGVWTPRDQWGLWPKTKGVSMILSDKVSTFGHQFRHEIAKPVSRGGVAGVDFYGPSYTPIGHDKSIAYRDYRYAIVVEAERSNNFFSEHLLDALAFGCIPIYWGCPNIETYFQHTGYEGNWSAGIWPFLDLPELEDRLTQAVPFLYHDHARAASWRPGVQAANLERLATYEITEDWMIEHGPLRPFVEALR